MDWSEATHIENPLCVHVSVLALGGRETETANEIQYLYNSVHVVSHRETNLRVEEVS